MTKKPPSLDCAHGIHAWRCVPCLQLKLLTIAAIMDEHVKQLLTAEDTLRRVTEALGPGITQRKQNTTPDGEMGCGLGEPWVGKHPLCELVTDWHIAAAQGDTDQPSDQKAELIELIRAVERATREDEKHECWTIRAFLEQRGVYDGNLTGSRRLVAEACRNVLAHCEAQDEASEEK